MGSWGFEFQTSFDLSEPGGGAMAVTASDGVDKLMSVEWDGVGCFFFSYFSFFGKWNKKHEFKN